MGSTEKLYNTTADRQDRFRRHDRQEQDLPMRMVTNEEACQLHNHIELFGS